MPNTYVRLLAQEFADHAAITEGTGIAPSQLAHYAHPITVRQHLRCIANVLPLRPGLDWHLQWGKRMAENFHGPVTLACLTAPTLGAGLDAFIRYMPGRIPYLTWSSRQVGSSFRCEVAPLKSLGPVRQMLIEVPLIVMHEYVRVMHRGAMTHARVELSEIPQHSRASYKRYFDCPVVGRSRNALVIPAAWRAIPNIEFDAAAWHTALERCDAATHSLDARDLVSRVRQVLGAALAKPRAGGVPTLEEVASQLHCSPRTVIRHLRASHSTYQDETEQLLKTRASSIVARVFSNCSVSS
jgi:Arabinose-binding domain of AraC transcription regulator, N-term